MTESDINGRYFNFAQYIFDQRQGDRPAFIDDRATISYADLELRSRGLACSLTELGLKREDRVLILMPDCIELTIVIMACTLAGFVPVIGNTWAMKKTITDYIESSLARVIVVENNRPLTANRSVDIAECLRSTTHQPDHILTQEQIVAMSAPGTYPNRPTLGDSDAFWLFTSGSTGETKAVVHSHRSMIGVGLSYGAVIGYKPTDCVFATSKLFFSWGISSAFICPLTYGACSILHSKLHTPFTAAHIFQQHQPTIFGSVPSFYVSLLNSDLQIDADQTRLYISAGEAITPTIQQAWQQQFKLPIIDGYGSTELLAPVIVNGQLVPGYQGQVRTDNNSAVEDQVGELYIQGPSMAVRYQNDLARSRETFVGTWCRTGDKFVQHGDQFQFCGRSKDMLKVNANWVSPVEIENILMSHELVHEAGVSGISNRYGLTAIVAYVVVNPVAAIPDNLEHQLKSLVRRCIEHYKSPDQIRWVRQLPKNTNGKIQRYLLNEAYNDNKI